MVDKDLIGDDTTPDTTAVSPLPTSGAVDSVFEIPESQRSPSLVESLDYFLELLQRIEASYPQVATSSKWFSNLFRPWFVEAHGDEELETALAERREQYGQLGFDGDEVKSRLERILTEDSQIANCCGNTSNLLVFLEEEYLGIVSMFTYKLKVDFDAREIQLRALRRKIYLHRFKKQAITHLFNVRLTEGNFEFGNLALRQFNLETISSLLGPHARRWVIHPLEVGECFIVEEDHDSVENPIEWLFEARNRSIQFARLLQYFKDGILHVGYSVSHFLPEWVNAVRGNDMLLVGERRLIPYEGGRRLYTLSQQEAQSVGEWWRLFALPDIASKLGDNRNSLGKLIEWAGDFYERYHTETDKAAKLIDLAISLESLYSPSEKTELSFRIAMSASCLLGATANERKEIFEFVRDMYNKRSRLVHGGLGQVISTDEIERLASVVRRSILRYLVIYLDGTASPDSIRARFTRCLLDLTEAESMRQESDPARFVDEQSRRFG